MSHWKDVNREEFGLEQATYLAGSTSVLIFFQIKSSVSFEKHGIKIFKC